MHYVQIGGLPLFRPLPEASELFWSEYEAHIRKELPEGSSRDVDLIKRYADVSFKWLKWVFEGAMSEIAADDLLRFFLGEYNRLKEIEQTKYWTGKLRHADKEVFEDIGRTMEKALRFTVEHLVQIAPQGEPTVKDADARLNASIAYLAMEEMVKMFIIMDQTVHLFPNKTTFTLHPPGSAVPVSVKLDPDISAELKKVWGDGDMVTEKELRTQLTQGDNPVEDDKGCLFRRRFLDAPFKEELGASFQDMREMVWALCEDFPAAKGVPFCKREGLLTTVQAHGKWSRDTAEIFVAGFSVDPERMTAQEKKEIWHRREYDSMFRPMLAFPHPEGPHLSWSIDMMKESTNMFSRRTAFSGMPKEWQKPKIMRAMRDMQHELSAWFEKLIHRLLSEKGIFGLHSCDVIGTGPDRLPVPGDVGEIDFIGYQPHLKAIVLVEDKLVKDTYLPKHYADDVKGFVTDEGSHAEKFRKKIEWVRQHTDEIVQALKSVSPEMKTLTDVQVDQVLPVMVTYYPTVAALFIEDFPCVSFPSLWRKLETNSSQWPYSQTFTPIRESSNQ